MTLAQAKADITKANASVTKQYRYSCGLESEWIDSEIKSQNFFNSPDYQNDDFHSELQRLGWKDGTYHAPYYWSLIKDDIQIEYIEGDVYLTSH